MALYCTDPALLRSESRFRKGPTRRNVNLGNGRFAMFNRERDISDGFLLTLTFLEEHNDRAC
jgi:hypothetical protein